MTGWVVVVPVKGSMASKTRLADFPLSPRERQRLALAFALDTVTAIRAAQDVRQLVVVTGDPEASAALAAVGATILADPGAGLNAAIDAGIAWARAANAKSAVAVMTADLPSLTTADVDASLALAAGHPGSFVADAAGTGTTTIAAQPGTPLVAQFGPGSAARHAAAGLVELPIAPASSVRRDVDTPADLERALRTGVGPHTARALAGA